MTTIDVPPRATAPPVPVRLAAHAVDATKEYGKGATLVRALDHVTVGFEAGKLTAIMGPSGSGKSTLLHCMAGLDGLTSGTVFIGDTDLTELRDRELTILRRTRVGFVFQSFNLVPTLTALENITLRSISTAGSRTGPGSTRSSPRSACRTAPTTGPRSCRAASSSGWR
jgi:putative ABC transport system ATP-binding protein